MHSLVLLVRYLLNPILQKSCQFIKYQRQLCVCGIGLSYGCRCEREHVMLPARITLPTSILELGWVGVFHTYNLVLDKEGIPDQTEGLGEKVTELE